MISMVVELVVMKKEMMMVRRCYNLLLKGYTELQDLVKDQKETQGRLWR